MLRTFIRLSRRLFQLTSLVHSETVWHNMSALQDVWPNIYFSQKLYFEFFYCKLTRLETDNVTYLTSLTCSSSSSIAASIFWLHELRVLQKWGKENIILYFWYIIWTIWYCPYLIVLFIKTVEDVPNSFGQYFSGIVYDNWLRFHWFWKSFLEIQVNEGSKNYTKMIQLLTFSIKTFSIATSSHLES